MFPVCQSTWGDISDSNSRIALSVIFLIAHVVLIWLCAVDFKVSRLERDYATEVRVRDTSVLLLAAFSVLRIIFLIVDPFIGLDATSARGSTAGVHSLHSALPVVLILLFNIATALLVAAHLKQIFFWRELLANPCTVLRHLLHTRFQYYAFSFLFTAVLLVLAFVANSQCSTDQNQSS